MAKIISNLDLSYCTFTNGTNPGHFTGAFGGAGRSKVTSIVLPVAAGNVRDFTNAFSNLSSVSGTGVTTLGGNDFTCFQNITTLKNVYFPRAEKTVTGGSSYVFRGCTGIERINIPLVTEIADDTFYQMPGTGAVAITIARNCEIGTIAAASAKWAAFKTYYEGTAANKGAGTYTYNGTSWTGPR